MLALVLLFLCLPSLVFAQGTTNARMQAGDGTPITDTTAGRLDVTVQSPVNAAQSGTWNITNLSGTVSLPTGAATETTLAALTAKYPTAFSSADNIAAQTATAIHGLLYGWDTGGSNWDRLLTTSGALHVNVQNSSLAVTGTFWQATQPISGTVTVTDGAGALNVIVDSGTVTAVTTITNPVTVTDGAGALNVICDSGCGSGTQYAEDTAHASGDQLSMAGVVQQTADAALAANGDRTALIVDENGNLKVNIKAGSGSSDGIVKDGTGDAGQANVTSGRLHVDGSGVTQPVSGTVTVTDGAGALNVICDSGCGSSTGIINDGTGDTTQANVTSGRLQVDASGATVPVSGTFWQATQPVSGTVTANAGTGTFYDGIIKDGTGDTTQANVSTGRLQVDGSGVTQPVSGTVTVTDGSGALNTIIDSSALPSGASTLAEQQTQTTALQLLDNAVSGAGFNVTQMNGVNVTMGNGASGTGVQRVTLANDSTGVLASVGTITNPVTVTDGAGALNVICDSGCGSGTQYAEDVAETAGMQLSMAGSVRRDTAASSATTTGDNATINTDATGRMWTNTELPDAAALADDTANPTVPAVGSFNMCWDGSTWDRCQKATAGAGSTDSTTQRVVQSYDSGVCNPKDTLQVAISISSSANNEIVALTSAQTIYICDLTLIANGTVGVQLIYGTGTACATGETNMSGVMPLIVNSGWTHNYDGRLKTAAANAFCLELSGAVQVDGILTYRKAATF